MLKIYWKGDNGVESFSIRFTNEELMQKWYAKINEQKLKKQGKSPTAGNEELQFHSMKGVIGIENPYRKEYLAEVDAETAAGEFEQEQQALNSEFDMSRNASSTSLRSRSATGSSGSSVHPLRLPQGPPPRFPMPELAALNTQMTPNAVSPAERIGASYFSPTMESPSSSRSSQQSSVYWNSSQSTLPASYSEESNRYTAPAMSRNASREAHQRAIQRPSLPAMAQTHSTTQQLAINQSRLRSASSPDIHNPNLPGSNIRRYPNGPAPGTDVPVPPIPPNVANMRAAQVNRSNSNSPTNGIPTNRTQSPGILAPPHVRSQPQQYSQQPQQYPPYGNFEQQIPYRSDPRQQLGTGNSTPAQFCRPETGSRPPSGDEVDNMLPSQIKVQVHFDTAYTTLVVPRNIQFRSIIDRIDVKFGRMGLRQFSHSQGTMRLRYKDEDGDFITIDSDEALGNMFQDWVESQKRTMQSPQGQLGQLDLFCHYSG